MSMSSHRSERQGKFWIPTEKMANSPGHQFYQRLSQLLDRHGFDQFVEQRCASFYTERLGRPSIMPGVYFRMLLIGYFAPPSGKAEIMGYFQQVLTAFPDFATEDGLVVVGNDTVVVEHLATGTYSAEWAEIPATGLPSPHFHMDIWDFT